MRIPVVAHKAAAGTSGIIIFMTSKCRYTTGNILKGVLYVMRVKKLKQIALSAFLAVLVIAGNSAGIVNAAAVYYQPNIKLQTFLNDGSITQPTAFQFAPDGRMFIAQRNGDVKIVWAGQNTANGLKHIDVDTSQEHGLLNMVLDPNFATNPYMYFYYTGTDAKVRIARAVVGSDYIEPLQVLWTARDPWTSQNHQGGGLDVDNWNQILFSTGDNYVSSNAQDVTNDYGKVFRIRTDGTIPADNPYLNTVGASPALFAIGVRNPFRLIVDRQTNTVYLSDVGQAAFEEIDKVDAGKNYGWPYREGNGACSIPDCSGFTGPLYSYAHPTNGNGAAINLNHAYYGNYYGGLFNDKLLYNDGMQGQLNMLSKTGVSEQVLTGIGYVVDMAPSPSGQLYLLDYYAGKIQRLIYGLGPLNDEPYANPTCTPVNVTVGSTVTCAANAGDQNNDPLTYSWDLGDGRTMTSANPTFSYANAGQYKVRLSINDTHTTVGWPPMTLNVGAQPHVELTSPDVSTLISAGSTINYSIAATEASGAPIDDNKVKLTVKFHHNSHTHDFIVNQLGKTGSFTIPTNIETDLDIWLDLYITVTDQNGADTTILRNVYYGQTTLLLDSNPHGAVITVDGADATNSSGFVGVTGIIRTLEAPDTYTAGGAGYRFSSWSDGNTNRSRTLAFPSAATSLTANYAYDPTLNPAPSLVSNGSFEQQTSNAPTDWSVLTANILSGSEQFNIAHSGAKGCQVTVVIAGIGAQKGCQTSVAIDANKSYTLENWYKSNRYSNVYVEYFNDTTMLGKVMLAKPPAVGDWAKLSFTITTPATANSVKIYQVIDGVGTLAVDDYALTAQ